MKKTVFRLSLALVAIVALSAAGNKYFEISKNLEVYSNVYKHLNTYYVDDLNPKDLVEVSIDAMLEELDPYSDYIPSEELENFRFQNTGKYGGIGSTIQKTDDYVTVVAPYKGSPADKAGLISGDKFFAINGVSAKGLESDEVVSQLKGDPGTDVTVTIDRDGKRFDKTITRQVIKVKNVPYYGMQDNGIAYIKLSSFTDGAGDEVRAALVDLKQSNDVKGIVLDLKGNGGGLLNEAIDVVNVFIPKNQLVVSTKGKVKKSNREYKTSQEPEDLTTPIAVLVDYGTASASEIVSGTIQDLDRGIIVGQRTFGKGLVQSTRPVAYNSQLKLTTSRYYIPSGRSIQRIIYSEKDEDGRPAEVPDSLRKEYKTLAGRKVLDGAGIEPDISLEEEEFAPITFIVFRNNYVYEYSLDYFKKHSKIADAAEFKLTDSDFEDFKNSLKGKDISYQTSTERKLEELKEKAKDDGYELLEPSIIELENKLAKAKEDDLDRNKDQIMFLLEREIANRYYYRAGRVENSLDDDEELQKAIQLLASQEYTTILAKR